MILISILLVLSLVANGLLIWFIRKLTEQFRVAVKNVDVYHELLNEYQTTLEAMYRMDEYYGDDTIKVVIQHTKMVSEACAGFRETMLNVTGEQENNVNNTTKEEQEGSQ